MRSKWIMTAAIVLSAAGGACTSSQARPGTANLRPPTSNLVTVRNDNWLDADVYVVHEGSRFRLGFVGGLKTETLPLPGNFIHQGTVQLLVDPVGSRATYTSEEIVVHPGQRIELMVNGVLSMSTFAVWNR